MLFLPVVALMVFNVYAVAIPGHRQDETRRTLGGAFGPDDLLFPPSIYANYLKYWETVQHGRTGPDLSIPRYGSEAALAALEKRSDETLCNQHLVLYTPYSFELYSDRQFERVGSSRAGVRRLFDPLPLTERFSYQTRKITVKVYSLIRPWMRPLRFALRMRIAPSCMLVVALFAMLGVLRLVSHRRAQPGHGWSPVDSLRAQSSSLPSMAADVSEPYTSSGENACAG